MKCYICGNEIFCVFVKQEGAIDVKDGQPTCRVSFSDGVPASHIETILCAKCGVMQYCAAAKNPWYTNQVSLMWDEEKQMLVDRKKVDLTNSAMTPEELTKLLREYVNQGGNLDEIIKKKEGK